MFFFLSVCLFEFFILSNTASGLLIIVNEVHFIHLKQKTILFLTHFLLV